MKLMFKNKPTIQATGRIAASLLLLFGLGASVPKPAHAIFGFGDIVFDPTSWAELVSSDLTMGQQLVHAISMGKDILNTYNMAKGMAMSFSHAQKSDFLTLAQLAVTDHVSNLNLKGESAGWSTAVNGANPSGAPAAWTAASIGLKDVSGLMSTESVGGNRLASLASINALDGSSVKCMQTISQYRGNSLANAAGPLLKTALAHLDGTAATNSQIQQANLSNAQLGQLTTELRAHGDLNSCLVEQTLVASKVQRDQLTRQMNFERDFQADLAIGSSSPANTSASFTRIIP